MQAPTDAVVYAHSPSISWEGICSKEFAANASAFWYPVWWLNWKASCLCVYRFERPCYLCPLAMAREEACQIEGLSSTWDQDEFIRDELRSGRALMAEVSDKNFDIRCCSTYKSILKPILLMMAENRRKLPGVDDLRAEVAEIYEMNKREPNDTDKIAWIIRKNLGFVKMKVRRREVSIDAMPV